jgi:hypothetical protein
MNFRIFKILKFIFFILFSILFKKELAKKLEEMMNVP